jgi:hypothetical protein
MSEAATRSAAKARIGQGRSYRVAWTTILASLEADCATLAAQLELTAQQAETRLQWSRDEVSIAETREQLNAEATEKFARQFRKPHLEQSPRERLFGRQAP